MDTAPRSLGWLKPLAIAVLIGSALLVVFQLGGDNWFGALGPALTVIAMVILLVNDARQRRRPTGRSSTRGDDPRPPLRPDRS